MSSQEIGTYDNPYHANNVYGHALALLRQHRTDCATDAVHLDLGCGYGRIAEPLTTELGRRYVGVDLDKSGLASLQSRGFETHQLCLAGEEETLAALRSTVAGRPLASITMLDTLGHLYDGDSVLRAISRLAAEHSALVVVSVPNVTHNDVGFKLAFGLWQYTKTGLLDHTYTRLFGLDQLDRVLRCAGLYKFDSKDVHVFSSEQNFPEEHPALARGTILNSFLTQIQSKAGTKGDVYQFVQICAPGAPAEDKTFLRESDIDRRPFLSVVIRTQGRRMHTLVEALTALSGQSDDDFEVIVVGHRLNRRQQLEVARTIEDTPVFLRDRCRLVLVDSGQRSRPLNEGFAAARGRYIAILDDDDMPFGHWVETFKMLARESPGQLLRAVAVRQDGVNIEVAGQAGLRAIGKLERLYPSSFDILMHLRVNNTPPISVAFPSGVFRDLGFRFDEDLTTTEDWDFILRTAAVVGVASSSEITSIYRWWPKDECSRTVHLPEEWQRNHIQILQKQNKMPALFPAGTLGRIRDLQDLCDGRGGDALFNAAAFPTLGAVEDPERKKRLMEVIAILTSTSWAMGLPFRLIRRLIGSPPPTFAKICNYSSDQLVALAFELRKSTTWRMTAPFRRFIVAAGLEQWMLNRKGSSQQ